MVKNQHILHMNFTPGQRISNRGEDFIINDIEPNNGSWILQVEGISELVKGMQFIFDTNIDKEIHALDPRKTKLVADMGHGSLKIKLFIENQIRNSPVYSKYITIADKGAYNEAAYQYEPTLKAFQLPRPRMLIADAVGLGKTIEAGIFLSEMIKRGKGKRILVLTPKSILSQFQQEIWNRFAIPLVRLDSEGISRIKTELPVNKNPFDYYDKTIVSIDTLKNNAKYQHYIEKTRWDIVVIDECHQVANIKSQRGSLAQLLSTKCESLIMLSATPHNGKRENFANLINMIEPLAIKDENNYTKKDILPYYVRRFKNQIDDADVMSNFQEREVRSIHAPLHPAEEDFLQMLQEIKFAALSGIEKEEEEGVPNLFAEKQSQTIEKKERKDLLFAISLFKSYMSSPEAARKSISNRIQRVKERGISSQLAEENITLLQELYDKVSTIITMEHDAKYTAFKNELIRLKWNGRPKDFRIVLFAERIETLQSLKDKLKHDFNLNDKVIADFHGSLTDMEQQRIIEDFGKEDSDYRILLSSDAGSQGVNLHYYCNHMFNYDIPWSLITLEQRNGRIDRYGQQKTPFIHYMVATSDVEGLRDDLHIVNKLTEKEEEVHKSLGDAASVYKLYDAVKEEALVKRSIAEQDATLLDRSHEEKEDDFDFFAALENDSTPPFQTTQLYEKQPSLFENDRSYYEALIQQLKSDGYLGNTDAFFEGELLEVKNTPELNRIMYDMPKESKPAVGELFQLTLNKDLVQQSIEEARKRQGEWARLQLLYELHPIVRYLMTQLEASVDKDVALVTKLNRLPENSVHYLLHGISANSLGQSLLSDFFVISLNMDGTLQHPPIAFDEFMETYKLNEQIHTQHISDEDINHLESLLPLAINFGSELHMRQEQQRLQREMEQQMEKYQKRMDEWEHDRKEQLRIEFEEKSDHGSVIRRYENKEREIETILNESSRYFQDLTSLKGEPYIKVIAAFYNN